MSENSLLSKNDLVSLLTSDKAFRDAFALEFVKNEIPIQLKALRKERGWTQEDLGLAVKKPRNVITRLENPNSNIPSISTMLEVAAGCGIGLSVKFVPFSRLVREYEAPFRSYSAPPINKVKEQNELYRWALEDDVEDTTGLEEVEKRQVAFTSLVGLDGGNNEPYQKEFDFNRNFALVHSDRTTSPLSDQVVDITNDKIRKARKTG